MFVAMAWLLCLIVSGKKASFITYDCCRILMDKSTAIGGLNLPRLDIITDFAG